MRGGGCRGPGRRTRRGVCAALAVAAVLLCLSASASAGTASSLCGSAGVEAIAHNGSSVTVTCTYTTTGEDTFAVPGGATNVSVRAVGAPGGAGGTTMGGGAVGHGGVGAVVAAPSLQVTPGSTLYVEVGGAGGTGCSGSAGAGGGGKAGNCLGGGAGGGGGGASGIQTCSAASPACVLTATAGDPRLIVAGGGGGGGGPVAVPADGGTGGGAGHSAISGAGNGGTSNCQAGGGAGAPGGVGAGGGQGGVSAPSVCGTYNGTAGGPGTGGNGSDDQSANAAAPGGGGGGYVGGGGGAANVEAGGGGGGGGSSFGPTGDSVTSAASTSVTPSVSISWTFTPVQPTVSIASPASGATFANGQAVTTSFVCSEGNPGLGISSCLDQNGHPSGTPIDTSHAGTYTLTVTGQTPDGLRQTSSAQYTVLPPAPQGATGQAWGISQTIALLDGTVNPEGANVTDCHFEYGSTATYGSSAPCAFSPGAGTSPVAVSAALSRLRSDTVYHYRLVVTGAGGTTRGSDGSFTTALEPCSARVGRVRVSRSTVIVTLTTSGSAGTTCTIHAKLARRHGGSLASKTLTLRAGGTKTLRLSLSTKDRRRLVAQQSLQATLKLKLTSGGKSSTLSSKRLTLRSR